MKKEHNINGLFPFLARGLLGNLDVTAGDATRNDAIPDPDKVKGYVDPLIQFVNPTDSGEDIPKEATENAASLLCDIARYFIRIGHYGDAFDTLYRTQSHNAFPEIGYELALLMFDLARNENYVSIYFSDHIHERLLSAFHFSRGLNSSKGQALHRVVGQRYNELRTIDDTLPKLEDLPRDFESQLISCYSNYTSFQILMRNSESVTPGTVINFFRRPEVGLKELASMHTFTLDKFPENQVIITALQERISASISGMIDAGDNAAVFYRLLQNGILKPSHCVGYYEGVKRAVFEYIKTLSKEKSFIVCNQILDERQGSPLFSLFASFDTSLNPVTWFVGRQLSRASIESYVQERLQQMFEEGNAETTNDETLDVRC